MKGKEVLVKRQKGKQGKRRWEVEERSPEKNKGVGGGKKGGVSRVGGEHSLGQGGENRREEKGKRCGEEKGAGKEEGR